MANPTDYVSIYEDDLLEYGEATSETILSYSNSEYINKFRVFIPPGTIIAVINIDIYDITVNDSFSAVARYTLPPSSDGKVFSEYTSGDITLSKYKLDDYKTTYHPGTSKPDSLLLLSDSVDITVSNCGWFYVKCGALPTSVTIEITVDITVDQTIYNNWYKTIDWEKDIESKQTYGQANPIDSGEGLTFYPALLDLGTQLVNKSKTMTFTLTNTLLTSIMINSIECPEGFSWSFAGSDGSAYVSYDFRSLYQEGPIKGFNKIYTFTNIQQANFDLITDPLDHTKFRLFVPYGTKSIGLFQLKFSPGAEAVAIVTWGQPPDKKYLDETSGFVETDYTTARTIPSYLRDMYDKRLPKKFRVVDDTITIIANSKNLETDYSYNGCGWSDLEMWRSVQSNPTSFCGWLFVILKIKSGSVLSSTFQSTVSVQSYFDQIKYAYDSYGDPVDKGIYIETGPGTIEGNPSGYETMHDPYHRIQENTNNNTEYTFLLKISVAQFDQFAPRQFQRYFVPPGTTSILISAGKTSCMRSCISRFIKPSESDNFILWRMECYDIRDNTTIVDCDDPRAQYGDSTNFRVIIDPPSDKRITECISSSLSACKKDIISINMAKEVTPVILKNITENDPGWFYLKYKESPQFGCIHANIFNITVNIEKFNEWWDNGGRDGVINWNKDVEQYIEYPYKKYTPPPEKPKLDYNPTINTTGYRTVHDPYYWLQDNVGEIQNYHVTPASDLGAYYDLYTPTDKSPAYTFCIFISDGSFIKTSYTKFRMFIPPGTFQTSLSITNSKTGSTFGESMMQSWANFGSPPTSVFLTMPNFNDPNPRKPNQTLPHTDLLGDLYNQGGMLTIFDNLDHAFDNENKNSNWLYVNVDKAKTEKLNVLFKINVDITVFNTWWKNCGSKDDKSINWDLDVENKERYTYTI